MGGGEERRGEEGGAYEIVCFFFQAEDGIRDIGVTGVQTCALPISSITEKRQVSSANNFTSHSKSDEISLM